MGDRNDVDSISFRHEIHQIEIVSIFFFDDRVGLSPLSGDDASPLPLQCSAAAAAAAPVRSRGVGEGRGVLDGEDDAGTRTDGLSFRPSPYVRSGWCSPARPLARSLAQRMVPVTPANPICLREPATRPRRDL